MRQTAFVLSSLPLLCGLSLGCGGAVVVEPIGAPENVETDPSSPPSSTSSQGAEPAESGGPTSIPTPPNGPYTPRVATTDVSILYPLFTTNRSGPVVVGTNTSVAPTDYLGTADVGNHGPLVSPQVLATAQPDGKLDGFSTTKVEYLGLVSLRLDPCSVRDVPAGECKSEVRAVFQQLAIRPWWNDGLYELEGVSASDGALHVSYNVEAGELVTMLQEILTLKLANGDVSSDKLGPHPILASQGLHGAFASGLRNIILSHLGADRIGAFSVFDHNRAAGTRPTWSFQNFQRTGTTFSRTTIPDSDDAEVEDVGVITLPNPPGGCYVPLEPQVDPRAASSVILANDATADFVGPLLSLDRPQAGAPTAKELAGFASALRVQDPTQHSAESTTCANCHLAEGARLNGVQDYGFDATQAFTHARSLAYVREDQSVTNLHAFGYLNHTVSVMQRTANESVIVADQMEAKIRATRTVQPTKAP